MDANIALCKNRLGTHEELDKNKQILVSLISAQHVFSYYYLLYVPKLLLVIQKRSEGGWCNRMLLWLWLLKQLNYKCLCLRGKQRH